MCRASWRGLSSAPTPVHSHTGLILPAGVYVEEEAERLFLQEVVDDPTETMSTDAAQQV